MIAPAKKKKSELEVVDIAGRSPAFFSSKVCLGKDERLFLVRPIRWAMGLRYVETWVIYYIGTCTF